MSKTFKDRKKDRDRKYKDIKEKQKEKKKWKTERLIQGDIEDEPISWKYLDCSEHFLDQ